MSKLAINIYDYIYVSEKLITTGTSIMKRNTRLLVTLDN